jgi:hypothetical protein
MATSLPSLIFLPEWQVESSHLLNSRGQWAERIPLEKNDVFLFLFCVGNQQLQEPAAITG